MVPNHQSVCNLLVLSREFSGMIHWLTISNHSSNPQQPSATHPLPATTNQYGNIINVSGFNHLEKY